MLSITLMRQDIENVMDFISADIDLNRNMLKQFLSTEVHNRRILYEMIEYLKNDADVAMELQGKEPINIPLVVVSVFWLKLYEANPEYKNSIIYIITQPSKSNDKFIVIHSEMTKEELEEVGINEKEKSMMQLFRQSEIPLMEEEKEYLMSRYNELVEMRKKGESLFAESNKYFEDDTKHLH